jgi:hypothetical protein
VLGVLWSFPPDRKWNENTLKRRLKSARAVLLPAALTSGSAGSVDASLPHSDWDKLPPELIARVTAAANRLGKPADRYLGRPPLVAGYLLTSDFREGLGLKSEALMAQVAGPVRDSGVIARNAAVLPIDRYTKALSGTTSAAGQACVEAALNEVETGAEKLKDSVSAWAVGDVAGALDTPRGLELCGFAVPGQADLRRAAIDAQVDAIAKALDGETGASARSQYVALANLRTLVVEDGVLDKLRRRGYQVRSPPD